MIRKLLCWLGWHEWFLHKCERFKDRELCNDYIWDLTCKNCRYLTERCKHCGKVK